MRKRTKRGFFAPVEKVMGTSEAVAPLARGPGQERLVEVSMPLSLTANGQIPPDLYDGSQ